MGKDQEQEVPRFEQRWLSLKLGWLQAGPPRLLVLHIHILLSLLLGFAAEGKKSKAGYLTVAKEKSFVIIFFLLVIKKFNYTDHNVTNISVLLLSLVLEILNFNLLKDIIIKTRVSHHIETCIKHVWHCFITQSKSARERGWVRGWTCKWFCIKDREKSRCQKIIKGVGYRANQVSFDNKP